MKKVLYVTNLPAPYKVEFFRLLSKNINLTVVYEREKASDRDDKWKCEQDGNFREIYLHGKNIGSEASFSMEILSILKKNKFDIVLMNGYSSPTAMLAITYMKMLRIKYAIVCDGMLPTQDSKVKYIIKKFLIKDAAYYLSSNDTTTGQLVKYGADKVKVYKYPFSSVSENDILDSKSDKNIYKEKIGCCEEKMILYAGQIIYRKGIDILINVFSKMDCNIRLFIVGGEKENATWIDGYENNKITYAGFKTKDELKDYFLAADLFVLPTREDIWGLVIQEAMSKGLPVITTDRCGAGTELVRNEENGYVVPCEDEQALASCIVSLLGDDEKLNSFGKKSLEIVRGYTIEKMAERHITVLEGE